MHEYHTNSKQGEFFYPEASKYINRNTHRTEKMSEIKTFYF